MNRAIGAVVVTVPSLSYILWPKKKNSHGHDHGSSEEHGDSKAHAEHNDGSKNEDADTEDGDGRNEESKGEESPEGSEAGKDGTIAEEGEGDKASGTAVDNESDDKSSSGEERGQDTPESSDDEQPATRRDVEEATEGHKEEAQFKGPTKDGPPGDHRISYPDSKGFKKKRIESNYGKPQEPSEGEDTVGSESDDVTDKVSDRASICSHTKVLLPTQRLTTFLLGCGCQACREPHHHVWQTRRYFQYGHEAFNRYSQ